VSFGAWLKKIVANRSLDSIKKQRMIFEIMDEKHVADMGEESTMDEIPADMDKIRDAIMNLPEGFRIVLSLYLLEGYDHEEIGQILNITSSTSRSQYTRARQKLNEILKKS